MPSRPVLLSAAGARGHAALRIPQGPTTATGRKDYEDRRRRQAQGIVKARDTGKFKGRAENIERNAGIAVMLRKGVIWNDIQDATDCSLATIAKIAARVKAAAYIDWPLRPRHRLNLIASPPV